MIRVFSALSLLGAGTMLAAAVSWKADAQEADRMRYSLVIHGGAGTITRDNMTAEREAAYNTALTDALKAGQAVLADGGTALDAVVTSIQVMEDSPLFNAGVGAVFTNAGRNELDASIMDGRTMNAGAVTGVTRVKSPIALARAVMEQSPHVMLAQEGAEEFARSVGVEIVSPLHFWTENRFKQLRAVQARDESATFLDHDLGPDAEKFGTVGAVALDSDGNLAAATSTGGMTNKMWGRIGDSPIIGAGTYASNKSCGVSGTGHGEYFIRYTVAREICALMEYTGASLQAAADEVVQNRLVEAGGGGGVIALDHAGNVAYSFNTEGMYRGHVSSAAPEPAIGIYKD